MVSHRTGLQFDSASGSLKAFVVQTGAVPAVTRWLASASAVLCGTHLPTRSHGSSHGSQQGSSTFKPLSVTRTSLLVPAAVASVSPLSLLRCSWLERAVVPGKRDFTLLVRRHSETLVVSEALLRWLREKPCGCMRMHAPPASAEGLQQGGWGAARRQGSRSCSEGREEHPTHGAIGDGEPPWAAG